jgi:undecaprenyl-diphosphatase
MWRNYIKARFDPDARFGLRLTLFAVALLLVAVPFGVLLREVTQSGPLTRIDTSAANGLHGYVRGSDLTVTILQVISFFGSPIWFYALIGPLAILMIRRGEPKVAAYLAGTPILGGIIDSVVKIVVDRPRPSLIDPVATAHGQSFPSGHSMTSVIGYGVLLLVFLPPKPRSRLYLGIAGGITMVLMIGFSRLVLGVHYISDVLGGFALGGAWLLASSAAFRIWRRPQTGRRTSSTEG